MPSPQQEPVASSSSSNSSSRSRSLKRRLESQESPGPCVVCGEPASGFHYSAVTCEACKSFFKRSVQEQHQYECLCNGNCPVNRRERKICQLCRLQKCLRSGMRPEDVRSDRSRGGRRRCDRTSRTQFDELVATIATSKPQQQQQQQQQEEEEETDASLEAFTEEAVAADAATATTFGDGACVGEWCARGLESVVAWGNRLPCLRRLLPADRVLLFSRNWFAVLLMESLARSLPFSGNLRLGADLSLTPAEAAAACEPALCAALRDLFASFDQLQLSCRELSLLRLLALLDHSVVDDIGVVSRTEPLRGRTLRSLYRECARKLGVDEGSERADVYASRLLLRLGDTVCLKLGLDSWKSLRAPSCQRATEIIARRLGADAGAETDAETDAGGQFRSRVYFKAMRVASSPHNASHNASQVPSPIEFPVDAACEQLAGYLFND